MRDKIAILFACFSVLSGCKTTVKMEEISQQIGSLLGGNTPAPTPSATAIPSSTPAPTSTPVPTSTPAPTATPAPTTTPPPVSCNSVPPAKYYVAPASMGGKDSNPGTFAQPFATWEKLGQVMKAGERAYIRSGTYKPINQNAAAGPLMEWENLNGTASAKIEIFAYPCDTPGTRPVMDFSNVPPVDFSVGFQIKNSQYVHIKGLRVTGLKQPGPVGEGGSGFVVDHCKQSTFENIEVDHIGGYGFRFVNGSEDLLVKNCDAHHMDDRYTPGGRAWGGANGFNITGGDTSTRVTFDGCRAWCISDDGFDFYSVDALVTIKNSWAFWNGYECTSTGRIPRGDGDGFKLGPANTDQWNNVLRVLTNNVSFENKLMGYDQNSGKMKYRLENNTSFRNGHTGFFFGHDETKSQISRNNLSYRDTSTYWGKDVIGSFNSWNFANLGLQDNHFLSVDSTGADGPRQADGSLPLLNFMKPASNSPLLNKGTPVNLPYNGTAPDLGAYELGF